MAQILKHVRALSTHQLLQFVTVVPLHWLKGNLQVIVTQQEMTSSDIIKASHMLQTFTNLNYLVYKRWEVGTLECLLETGHLIEDTPEGPYVTLGVVRASLALKRSKVIVVQQ